MGNMSVPHILEHNFLNPNDYLDRKWLAENGPIPSDVSAIWKAEDHIGSQLKKMIDASGEPAYDSALKLQMRTLLEEDMGINSERAKTLVDSGYVGKVTNRPTEKPNFVQAAADTFLAVQYSRERGNAFTKYILTGDERFKQVADRYAEKEKQHSVGTDDWGFFGNQIVSTAKIASSTLNSIVGGVAITGLTTLAGAIVGGPAGAAAGHGIGKALASAFVMWDAGSSQAGSSLYELSQMTDENGQIIDLESPLAKTIFLVDLLANGAIEVVGMDFLPGYKQLIDAVGPSVARNAIKTTFKQSLQKYGKDVLEGALAEGGEEFFQGWVSDLSNNLLISMTNSKHGTDFDTKKAEAILGDSLSAFVETAKGMITYGMLTAGVGNGVRGARMKIESSRNQKDEEGSLTIDSAILNAKKSMQDDEYKPTDKLPPIKVIKTESGAIPATVDDAKIASFLKFNKKASAVKVVPVEAKISTGSHDKITRNLAYQLDLKVDENSRYVADDETQLATVVSQIQKTLGVISSKQNGDGSTTFSLLNENNESVDFTVGLANQESRLSAIEPDYGTMDTKLQRILKPKDKYLDAEEHEFVRNRVLESLDGNFTDRDVEAGVNSIMIASRALKMTTDELLDHHIQIRFATDDDARQIGQADARGWLEKPIVAANGDVIHTIRLTKNADESTIVHETGHVLRKLASADQLSSFAEAYGGSVGAMWLEDIREDNGRYLIGEKSFETYAEAFNVIRENEERFADDFVSYLMDGVAPTEEMKGLFARMKEFLKSVYNQFKDRLSNETRKAFDKLFGVGQPGNQGGLLTGNTLFQENSEYQAIVAKYKDTPLWMKAPNGRPTNLTERQWVQVRTPSFKKWFGDWEASETLKWLMNADPVSSLPKMIFQKGEQDNLVDSILDYWKERVVSHPEIGDIVLDKEGVKSSIGHGLGREKASAFALIPEIIEKGRIISRQSNWKDRGYDTAVIVAPIEMGGIQYVSEVVVVQRPAATKFYLHEVEIRKRFEGAFKTPTEGSAPRTSRLMISRLLAEGKLASSMGVDENGEPQVFYHGSYTDDIAEFIHQPRLGFQNQAGSRGGFSFTNNRKVAEGYAKPRETRMASISKYVRDIERALDEEGIVDAGMLEDPSDLDARSIRFYELLEADEKTEYAAYERTLPQFEYVYWDNDDNPISEGRALWSKHIPQVIESEFPVLAKKLRKAGRELRIGKGNTTPKVYDVFLRIPEGTNTKNLTPSTLYLIGDDFSVQNEKTGAFMVLMPGGEKVVYIATSNMIKSAVDNNGLFAFDNPGIFFQEAADARYFRALAEGDEDTARKIVDDQARRKGYLSNNDFRMNHKAPNAHDGFSANLARIEETDLIPDGFWEHPSWYAGDGEMYSFWKVKEAVDRYKKNGKSIIRLYRAIPKNIKEDMFRNGDWVTPDPEYARREGEGIPEGYRLIRHAVPLEHVWWDVNSIAELGYDDGGDYAYRDTKNNRKLNDTIVRDGDGNIVPPSKRFNNRSSEVFFQESDQFNDNDIVTIDGIDHVKHDLGYEWNRTEIERLSNEVAEHLERILAHPGIQYEFDFGDQSTNGSLFVDRPGEGDVFNVRSENRNHIRGYTPVRGWDGTEGSPRIDEDWKRFRKIDFTDYVVHSSSDVAQLFSIYRNPEIEFFHIIFTKGDKIVAHHALTSGLPGRTFAVDKNFPASILEMYKKYDADGYYLLHNHPSGDTEPSREDLNVSLRYSSTIKGYKGHIILNHNKFGFIDDFINSRQISASGFHNIPERSLVDANSINKLSDIASIAKRLMDQRGNLVLFLDNQNRVALAEPVDQIDVDVVFEKIVNANISKVAVLVTEWAAYHKLVGDYEVSSNKNGKFVLDLLKIDSDGSYISAAENGDLPFRPLSWQSIKSKAILGTQDFLFQLSDQKQRDLLLNRRYEIQQLVSGHFYIKDQLLEEFAGEEWADEEIRFRKVLKEFPWVLDAAKKFENVDDYLESLKSDPMYETSEYEWQEEDEQWFRRIFDYSQIPTPDDLDRQFVQQYTTDPKMLLMLSKKMRNYEDVGIPIQHRTYKQPTFIRKFGAFKGVSTKFLRLSNESSLAEISQVVDVIQANPRPYRKALQIVELAESRVLEARGIGGRENIAHDYYSAFGEELEDDLKKLQEESEEQAKQERLKSIPQEIRSKSVSEISELEQSSESVLRNLGEQDSTAAELSKKLEQATAIAKGISGKLEATRLELQQSQQEYQKLRSELEKEELKLKRRDARITSLLDKLVQSKQTNISLDKELGETQRDLISQSEWRAFFKNLAELRGKRVYQQEQKIRGLIADLQDRRERVSTLRDELTAANRENFRLKNALQAAKNREATRKFRQAFKDVQARIIKNSTFNGNTMDAYFEEAMSYVHNLFNKDVVTYPGKFPEVLRDYMPDWFNGYESMPRGDNRMASWSIDEILAIDAAALIMVTDARVKKVARDGEIQAIRQQIALQHFRQIYFRMPKLQVASGKGANMMADIAEDVNTTKQKYHNGQEGNWAKTWHSITMSFAHIQRIARLVDGNMEGAMYNLFVRDLWDGYNTEYREIQRRFAALEEKRKALNITDQYLAQELITYKAGGATDITLTREEAIGVYIYSKNKMAMEKLLSHGGNGMSVFDISEIVAKLEKKDIEFGNYLIESIGGDAEYERLKAATYRIYNITLGREEHYFPLRAKGLEVEGSADLITGPTRSSISYIDKGMTVERVHSKYQVDLAVVGTWQDVMRQQEHLMALGQWVKDANYLLGPNGAVGHTISINFGSTIRQAMQDFVNRVAGQKDNARYVSKIFNTMLSKASASMISYNASSMMKQMASLSAVLRGGVNPVRFFQMMLSPVGPHPQLKNWKAARNLMYELAPDMKSRTFNVEVQRFRNLKNTTQAGRTLKKFTDFGLEHGTGAVDSIVVTRLWWAAYMTALDKKLASKDAVFRASQFIAETQSTTNQMDMSLIQQSENSFFRIITQFRNDAFQHWNQIFFDLPYHIRNKMWTNAAGDLTSVLMGSVIITIATGAFLGGGGDEEKWWLKFLRALFPNILGEFIPFAGEAVASGFTGYSSGGIISLGKDIGSWTLEATDMDGDWESLGNKTWDLIASLGTTAGIATLTPKRIIKSIAEENPWRLIGGYWYRMWEDAQ